MIIAAAYDYAPQDGKSANQSIPHVHVHVIPRTPTDTHAGSDEFYDRLEKHEYEMASVQRLQHPTLQVPSDEDRKPRTNDEMESEARWLATFFDAET